MEKGRYTAYRRQRLPKRKRTIRQDGSFEDRNRYVKCWNCGHIVDRDTDLGDPTHQATFQTEAVIEENNIIGSGDPLRIMSILHLFGWLGVGLQSGGLSGEPITTYYTPRMTSVAKGCPLCGVVNL